MKFNVITTAGLQTVNIDQGTFAAMREQGSPTVAQHIERSLTAPIPAGEASALNQIAFQMGITPGTTIEDAMSGKGYRGPEGAQAASVGGDGSVTGRLVTQAILFQAIENHLRDDLTGYGRMLQVNAALNRSLTTTTWETPILNFKRPANSKPQPVAQLSEPARMLTLTTSMKKNAIMGEAIGIEFSDQVTRNITIDVIALSLKRQAEESAAHRSMYQIMTLLNGDPDFNMPALASVIPGGSVQASSLDPAATGGKLTQAAWIKFLWRNNLRRTITTVVTDLDGALAIENRLNRPTVDNEKVSSNRIDTLDSVINPRWPDKVDVIITQDPEWPANTIVAFDKRFGYNYITSTAVDYKATEEDLIRRGTKMRFDTGSMVERFMPDAWDILVLA
jgi:hypothetical protein